jgi:hypothetical protein
MPRALQVAQALQLGVAVARASDLGTGIAELVDVAARQPIGLDDRHRLVDPRGVGLVEGRVGPGRVRDDDLAGKRSGEARRAGRA